MEQAKTFFNEYNSLVGRCFEEIIEEAEKLEITNAEERLKERIKDEETKWKHIPSEGLEGKTPLEYIDSIDKFDKMLECFKTGALVSDSEMPEIFLDKFRTFGEKATQALMNMAFDVETINDDDTYFISLMAIRVLGIWRISAAVPNMIDLLKQTADDVIIFAEEIKNALVLIGEPIVKILVSNINTEDAVDEAKEYLLTALSEIGSKAHSEDVFYCLKNTFRRMDNKVIGAICLGTYGDGRAIPALRGYVQRNIDTIDKDTFMQIRSEVMKLGGNMDDIRFPNK